MVVPSLAFAGCNPNITRTLSYGSRGADVSQLQLFLGDWVNPPLFTEAPTSFFGRITESAVQQFQCKQNIVCSGSPETTGWGVVGPTTRAVIGMVCNTSAQSSYPSTVPGNSTPIQPSNTSLIQALLAQIQILQQKIAEIQRQNNQPSACAFNSQSIPNGSSVTAYQSSSVSSGNSCVFETRTCTNGTLSGSYQYSSCTLASNTDPKIDAFVEKLYLHVLGRASDSQGKAGHVASLQQNRSYTQCVNMWEDFYTSSEFLQRSLSNEAYIQSLYNAVLGRAADAPGLNHWVKALATRTRADVRAEFEKVLEAENYCRTTLGLSLKADPDYTFDASNLGGSAEAVWKTIDAGDFNGDGKADIVWQRSTDGAIYVWFTKGDASGFTSVTNLHGTVEANWKAIAAGDFNGDAKADILFYNTVTAAISVWLTKSDLNGFTPSGLSGAAENTSWVPVTTGDFNGDGKADVLWGKTDGSASVWLTKSDLSGFTPSTGGTPESGWKIVDAADFNSDGKADILWHHITGGLSVWLMRDDLSAFNGSQLQGSADSSWTAKTAGDFNRDGKADVAWQNVSGAIYVWFTKSDLSGFNATTNLDGYAEPGWDTVAAGDYNGDGRADLLFHNVSGAVAVWFTKPPL